MMLISSFSRSLRTLVAAAVMLALCAAPGYAASTLTVTSQGGGVFLLQGQGMEGASALDLTVQYDPGSLGNPRMEQGPLISGAMTAVNTTVPGTVRIAVIRIAPITGSGTIATLSFERSGSAPDPIKALIVKLTDVNGRPLPVQVHIAAVPQTASSDSRQQASSPQTTSPQGASATAPSTVPAVPLIVSPGITVRAPEGDAPRQDTAPEAKKEPAPRTAKADDAARKGTDISTEPAAKAKGVFTQKSVLELFREHRGPRTPEALIALFGREPLIGCRQQPSPVLSDGTATAQVTFIAPEGLKGSPSIALVGASLVSLTRDRDNTNTWVAVVRPHADVIEARMTVPLTEHVMVIPLTVAPKRDIGAKGSVMMTEKDFEQYLKTSGGEKTPGRDLNRDGVVNYLDDYLFTANYLATLNAHGRAATK